MANQVVKLKKGSDYLYPYADLIGIDASNLLSSQRGVYLTPIFTATQDCFVIFVGWRGQQYYIDGNEFHLQTGASNNPDEYGYLTFYLKKGQVLTGGYCVYMDIYGIKRTTN